MEPEQSVEQFKSKARLPDFIVPKLYDLSLNPDLSSTCKFAGAVQIAVDVVASTRIVVLNASDLVVVDGSASFKKESSSQELLTLEIVNVEEDEILAIQFNEVLPIGEGVLSIGFEGILSVKMKGFYRSGMGKEVANMSLGEELDSVVISSGTDDMDPHVDGTKELLKVLLLKNLLQMETVWLVLTKRMEQTT